MKKKLLSLLVVLTLAVGLSVPVFAAQTQETPTVLDLADLLTDQEEQELKTKAEDLAEKYQCGVYLLTLPDYKSVVNVNDAYAAADEIYLNQTDWGVGSDRSGVLLMLSMSERDFALMSHGYGNTAFTDYGKKELSQKFLDDFREDNWAQGFEDYVDTCGVMLQKAQTGEAVDVTSNGHSRMYGIVASIGIAFLIALVVVLVLRSQLKSVAKKTEAAAYITRGGVRMNNSYEHYTHTTQVRVYEKPPEQNGGTTVNQNGSSGMSGKF